jgi:long-chain acyl-CoA synthetase
VSVPDTIPHRLFQQAKRAPSRPAYHVKVGETWRATSWEAYAGEVRRAARALVALGVEPGGTVAILGFNRPEWIILDLAAMTVGAAPAGVYTTCSAEEIEYIAGHAESTVMLLEREEHWEKIAPLRAELPRLRHVVMMKGAPEIADDMVLSWEQFMARADEVDEAEVDRRLEALEPDGLATLIYTSGTTGPPKGVMLSHRNLAWTAQALGDLSSHSPDDCVLSYLPLSHIAEQMLSIHGPISSGAAVYFAESIEKVLDNLKEVQPTLVFGVPRVWEKLHAGVSERLAAATGLKKALIGFVRSTCREVNEAKNRGERPGLLLRARYFAADRLVLSRLKPMLGLGRARICVSGAAPIAREVLEDLAALDVVISEVYGQSEDTGPTTFNRPGMTRLGTVGTRIPGVEVKIADDGEILVKGPNVFLGYLKDEEATREVLRDGWLHSGDLGELDADGYLSITGRKKEIIITAGGKNIAPKNIEAALKNARLVNEAIVIGDRRKYLTALVTLDEEATSAFLSERGEKNSVALNEHPAVLAAVQAAVDEVNAKLAQVETVKKFTILPRNLTVDRGELTPTLKVKRKVVNESFADAIEAMYR